MTIYDISEKAGVSIATVSRVLNGSQSVSEKTRQKVLDVIEQCGYTPNAFARGLGLNTMKTIGIMCADSSDLYLAKAVYYIEQKLRGHGYDSLLSCTGYDLEAKEYSMNLLITKKVDGIILVGSNFVYERETDNRYIAEAAAQVPVMVLNAAMDTPNVYSIMSDDFTSMYNATREMLAGGIRDILYFYNSRSYSGRKKLAGFQAAMEEQLLPGIAPSVEFYRGSHEDVHAMVRHLKAVWDPGAGCRQICRRNGIPGSGRVFCHRLQQFHAGLLLPAGADQHRQQAGDSLRAPDLHPVGHSGGKGDAQEDRFLRRDRAARNHPQPRP